MKLIAPILTLISAASLPIHFFILAVGVIMVLDTWFGGLAIWKFKRNEFSWRKLLGGLIYKMSLYTPAMAGVYILDVVSFNDMVIQIVPIDMFISRIGAILISLKELLSIDKNWKLLTGRNFKEWTNFLFDIISDVKDKILNIKNKK